MFSRISEISTTSSFILFYNLALKKIRRRTYEHWCKIEALFISCKDQISIHYLQVMSDSFKWIWHTSLQLLTYVQGITIYSLIFVELYGYLWFKWTKTASSCLLNSRHKVAYQRLMLMYFWRHWLLFSFLDAITFIL